MTRSGEPARGGSAASRAAILGALRRRGPLTRQRLAAETGLSRATVSAVLRALTEDGQVRESASRVEGGRGRPSSVVTVNPARAELVGIELGRAHLAVAVADGADTVVGQAGHEMPVGTSVTAATAEALELLDRLAAERGLDLSVVRSVAVGTPGPKFGGTGRPSPDLALARFAHDRAEVANLLTARFRCPVRADNNTRYTALGEASHGAGAGAANVVCVRLDEGVGGGVVVDGSLLSGQWGTAGEFGHVSVDPAGARCACGGRGCLELSAALPALLTATGTAGAAALAEAVTTGPGRAVLERAALATAQALAGPLTALDVPVLVLGGRVARLPGFLAAVGETLQDLLPTWCAAGLSVRPAADDGAAGALGALIRARAAAETGTALSMKRMKQ
ncbi:ROK family transcriptional regulator [Amycolatopsis jiangsuensis]|uniref:Putative NBD/HSP70 family sugar kinase n=1 Tax=Amycolatopsis jiangsuensis TaxID=1181879 RepID=A0A840IRD3_9PSEU|nr:ROK family transcriptional regulator [Amycolatopsis jiangsuensis]MBB4684005.1 putative NBD/HSP70 family sugar kinase [Amycolatopsis jiangsuensis]